MIPISIEKIGAVTGGIVTLPEGDDSVLVIDRITEGLRYVADNDLYCCPITDLLSAQKAMILARLRGAAATLSEAPPYSNKLPHIQVPDYMAAIRSLAAKMNIDALVCIGELAESIALGALDAGFPKEGCACYPSVDAFLAEKHPFSAGSTVLLKASHAMGFERILRRLQT